VPATTTVLISLEYLLVGQAIVFQWPVTAQKLDPAPQKTS